MTNRFNHGMAKVTALTRSGNLSGATALIQSLLAKADTPRLAMDQTDADLSGTGVIEGDFTRLDSPVPMPAAPKAPRNTLRETLRKIGAGGMPAHAPLAALRPALPQGAQFITLTHASAHGSRDYKLYIPATQPAGPMPLIIMLHGCTQSPDDFAAGTGMNALAEAQGLLIAYPAQPSGANANKCWNWFNPGDQARDRGEPALIAGLTRDILRNYPADPARVYIAGLSAGGAAAMIVASAYPELFSAAGVHSGLAIGAARDIPSAFAAMRTGAAGLAQITAMPTIVIHGTADSTVDLRNGQAVTAQAVTAQAKGANPGLTATTRNGTAPGGRRFTQTLHIDPAGRSVCEHWEIDGAGHAWAGGNAAGSFTDPKGPDASQEMLRFFLQHHRN